MHGEYFTGKRRNRIGIALNVNSRIRRILFFAVVGMMVCGTASAGTQMDRLGYVESEMAQEYSMPIENWRFNQANITDAQQPGCNDETWQTVSPGFSWSAKNQGVWFRTKIVIPPKMAGQSVEGVPVQLQLGVNPHAELYLDGQLKEAFGGDNGLYTLTEHARPGQTINVAIHAASGAGGGEFHFARLYFDVMPELDQYIEEIQFVRLLINHVPAGEREVLQQALDTSEGLIHFSEVRPDNFALDRAELEKAQAALSPVAAITKKYQVFYIGHAHIDMNWLWPWSETIDVCRRTWNSAMNLMAQFPDFYYVQSQPAAYVPIETMYPKEFARMQADATRGQWDLVGGMWNESDTNIPSGEGLARSFLLGQRYFKSKFGKYAIVGWLPDSFGHTWQLPQIMLLAGLRYFYHMRCGNGMEFTWWESPDGSRVLKANTSSYDAKPELSQLVVPMENESRFQLPQSVVIFGVGDHGGGPTREQILRIESYRLDPIFPRVHFASADTFFNQLAKQPAAASLPIVDTGLQYTFEGCYTTHADIKKAIRFSENNLYSAEVLSSLSAMMGQRYPVKGFRDAWKPTAFAQFHDIACGSAIHSTYDWMHQQLAPAFNFEKDQTRKSLRFLAANVDTRGPAKTAIVVWNTLSFPRNDVVKARVTDAARYHSVVDEQGNRFAAQAMGRDTLIFVARDVPAFGHAVYFPETESSRSDGIVLHDAGNTCDIETPLLDVRIDKATGTISRLYSRTAGWNVLDTAGDANALQLLGDTGDAWDINYTGKSEILTAEGAKVSVLDQGPVFVRVGVTHTTGKSSYTQDVTVYGALPRIDVPTTVNWQEVHELLKVRFPVNADHPTACAQIPFGSVNRPTNGQECPGQKWMDVSQVVPETVEGGTPLELSGLFDENCTSNFDGDRNAFPAELLPAAGIHRLGADKVPFKLAGNSPSQPDNVVASGQHLELPADDKGNTLFLLANCVNGGRWTDIGFHLADGRTEFRAFDLNDWVFGTYPDNALGLRFAYRLSAGNRDTAAAPKMWIVQIPLPKGATELILPHDPRVHIFAATVATKPPVRTLYGLSVLNNCKYGFDVQNNLLRLTALRSSTSPDPHPDQGIQKFTYSIYPHAGSWRVGHTDEEALDLNIPLLSMVTKPHPAVGPIPTLSLNNIDEKGDLIVTALKHSEDGHGFILRFYEADGRNTKAQVNFDQPVKVEETDILERPLPKQEITMRGNSVTLPVDHNKIITLHFRAVSSDAGPH